MIPTITDTIAKRDAIPTLAQRARVLALEVLRLDKTTARAVRQTGRSGAVIQASHVYPATLALAEGILAEVPEAAAEHNAQAAVAELNEEIAALQREDRERRSHVENCHAAGELMISSGYVWERQEGQTSPHWTDEDPSPLRLDRAETVRRLAALIEDEGDTFDVEAKARLALDMAGAGPLKCHGWIIRGSL